MCRHGTYAREFDMHNHLAKLDSTVFASAFVQSVYTCINNGKRLVVLTTFNFKKCHGLCVSWKPRERRPCFLERRGRSPRRPKRGSEAAYIIYSEFFSDWLAGWLATKLIFPRLVIKTAKSWYHSIPWLLTTVHYYFFFNKKFSSKTFSYGQIWTKYFVKE
jgi:hypothetical protein